MLTDNQDRLNSPLMERYHSVFSTSKQWDGTSPLKGKRVIIYCEQGYGDIIQFSRYFKKIKELGAYTILYCPKPLHRLFSHMEMADEILDKHSCDILPQHDCHILSMSLPFLLNLVEEKEDLSPYISVPVKTDLSGIGTEPSYFKIGIVWEGSPNHSNNCDRSCPLQYFDQLNCVKNIQLFALQNTIENKKLLKNCDDMVLYGSEINDFYDTASLINSLDIVVTVDTAVLHLAGAMGKCVYGLLSYRHDPRWAMKRWYSDVTFISQKRFGDWDSVFDQLFMHLGIQNERKRLCPVPNDETILLTGGIGDVITLESFMPNDMKEKVHSVYYATRVETQVREIISSSNCFPKLKKEETVWNDFDDFFAIYSKSQCTYMMNDEPVGWDEVSDWSIVPKFQEIELGRYKYSGSTLLLNKLAEIESPNNYVVIVPYSENDLRRHDRNFTEEDWLGTVSFLNRRGLVGVVLGGKKYSLVPNEPCLINMSGKTKLTESIEFLKNADGYIGIDSWLSVLAAKLFDDNLFVKSTDKHLLRWKKVYYAPKTNFDFIGGIVNI